MIDQNKTATGVEIPTEAIARVSPGRFEHINPYGMYFFDLETISEPVGQRPLHLTSPRQTKNSCRKFQK